MIGSNSVGIYFFYFLGLTHAPSIELSDGLPLQRQLDVLIAFVDVPKGVSQKRHANLTGNRELKQSSVEGMAQVVESDIADSSPAESRLPAGFDTLDWLPCKRKDQAGILLLAGKQTEDSFS